ncbi:MAG: hypothetical protein LCH73_04095 [Proteobacteria bacterium]|nr:hypothetical protein [Pseudomonadota bacterium]
MKHTPTDWECAKQDEAVGELKKSEAAKPPQDDLKLSVGALTKTGGTRHLRATKQTTSSRSEVLVRWP